MKDELQARYDYPDDEKIKEWYLAQKYLDEIQAPVANLAGIKLSLMGRIREVRKRLLLLD